VVGSARWLLLLPLMKDDVMDLNHELVADLGLEDLYSESLLERTRSGDLDEVRWKLILRGSFSLRTTVRCFWHSVISKV